MRLGLFCLGVKVKPIQVTLVELVASRWGSEACTGSEYKVISGGHAFRGVSALLIEQANKPTNAPLEDQEARDVFENFSKVTLSRREQLLTLLTEPLKKEVLRNPATNSIVGLVAADLEANKAINQAVADFMSLCSSNPSKAGLQEVPGLLGYDCRSLPGEFTSNTQSSGNNVLGGIVMVCPEEVVVERTSGSGTTEQREQLLKARNRADRNRSYAPMSLPEDFVDPQDASEHIEASRCSQMYDAGRLAGESPETSPLVIDTSIVGLDGLSLGLPIIMSGMSEGFSQRSRQESINY